MRTDVDTLVKQRELAHERGEKAAAALAKNVVKNMENQWSLFFNVERDADPAVIDASIESLLLESRENARILTKNKTIDYVRRQLRIYTEVFQIPQFKISKGVRPFKLSATNSSQSSVNFLPAACPTVRCAKRSRVTP